MEKSSQSLSPKVSEDERSITLTVSDGEIGAEHRTQQSEQADGLHSSTNAEPADCPSLAIAATAQVSEPLASTSQIEEPATGPTQSLNAETGQEPDQTHAIGGDASADTAHTLNRSGRNTKFILFWLALVLAIIGSSVRYFETSDVAGKSAEEISSMAWAEYLQTGGSEPRRAIRLFQLAVDRGDPEGYAGLGFIAQVLGQTARSRYYFERGVASGSASSMHRLASELESTFIAPNSNMAKRVMQLYGAAARQSYGPSLLRLMDIHLNGTYGPIDTRKSFECAKRAAELGEWSAQSRAGHCYFLGCGVKQDLTKAFHWLKLAYEQGDTSACKELGDLYLYGWGVTPDFNKAKECYEAGAADFRPGCLIQLGWIYEHGLGVERDLQEARKHYARSRDELLAEYHKARLIKYHSSDTQRAERILAAVKGLLINDFQSTLDPELAYTVGQMYEHGDGVQQDASEARLWYQRSALGNWPAALKQLNIKSPGIRHRD